ncbi:hypothetical protein LTR84_000565 [Exophiala bonariae]|uniref:T6SS Phospholipase effector Tle1-like catalytic domain-containing protein n=1 Tax=Exophiala bonariae TaxID=1690606 RepID=A0AAV9NQW9_9EURO|nr:hypothetical protein LTR84_000565 [Exophiala bonariae]
MSRPPIPRSSVASGLAPPLAPPGYPGSVHASGVFPPPPPLSAAPSRPQSRVEPPPLSATLGPMPGTLERPIAGPRKRLIVTCDGTWLDADNGLSNGQKQIPSNVSRIGWAIKDTSRDGIPQVVNYQAGVGTMGGRASRTFSGATGFGLKENMREAYTYLAINWKAGDEMFLMGFSRGAFTARSIGGMIGALGLLTRAGLPFFNEIFEDWEHRFDERYESKYPETPFPDKGPFDQHYVDELVKRGLTIMNVPIKAICCWDTVGSLGIPKTGLLSSIGIVNPGVHEYEFYDTRLHPCIENAFQALALDERRSPFSPALWEKRDNDRTNLVQCWFPGVHSNVGGGYEDQDLSNITLAWMMSKLEPFLDFRSNFLIGLWEENRRTYKLSGQKTRPWAFGELYNSVKGFYSLTGTKTRTPGNYYRTDPQNGRPTSKRLKNTNEFIHASVRARLGLQGPGSQDRGIYDPPALKDWTFEAEMLPPGQGGNADHLAVIWTDHNAKNTGGQEKIPEAIISETELVLLKQTPRTYDYVLDLRPSAKEKRRSRRVEQFDGAPPPRPSSQAPPHASGRRTGRLNPDGLPESEEDRERRKRRSHRESRDPEKARRRRSRRYDE